jgi:hypothetical protein
MPTPGDVERRAEVLAGQPIDRLERWYPSRSTSIDMHGLGQGPAAIRRHGHGGEIEPAADYHPVPLAEALRWQVAEAGLLQAIGRGRGVNRSAESPLQVDLLTNVVLPISVDEAGPFDVFEPSSVDLMVARGIMIKELGSKGSWPVVAMILADLFSTADAARKALERSPGQNPYVFSVGKCPSESWGRVKLAGARYSVPVLIDAATENDAHALLAKRLPGAALVEFTPSSIGTADPHPRCITACSCHHHSPPQTPLAPTMFNHASAGTQLIDRTVQRGSNGQQTSDPTLQVDTPS